MTVYHGSNVEVREPKILKPNRELDFGNGFYTTTNIDQAIAFSRRVTQNRGVGAPTVSVYEIDEKAAFPLCEVVKFDGVCDAWLDFVCDNRDGTYSGPQYDFAFGPVANDDVYRTLYLYRAGEIDREETFKRLKVKKLYNQLVFASTLALSFIRFRRSEVYDV
ncbi:MAG: DUF3990 domain-containing protein [Kiritimatiellae bacterium]|nr:DUF3990 domain-containing protein [Kiritimatiellia bacterium]